MEAPAQSVSSCLTGRKRRSLPWARPVVQVAFDGDQLWKLVWLGWPTRPLSRMIYRCGPQGSKDNLLMQRSRPARHQQAWVDLYF